MSKDSVNMFVIYSDNFNIVYSCVHFVISGLRYHSDRLASRDAVNFTAFEAIGVEDVADSIKIHGKSCHIPYFNKLIVF